MTRRKREVIERAATFVRRKKNRHLLDFTNGS